MPNAKTPPPRKQPPRRPPRPRSAPTRPAAHAAAQPSADPNRQPGSTPDRPFYDVFISYRHHDAPAVDALEDRIRAAGFEPFRDLNFPSLADTAEVGPDKIALIRAQLQRATCLIFAFSHASGRRHGQGLGVWMPWELGFFDGALGSRIGVYLLDGPRPPEMSAQDCYRGSEYLQLYPELHEGNLEGFLRRHAVRERRIDNVASAFVWMQHMARECLANPLNVQLGVAEWWADHASRWWRAHGQEPVAQQFEGLKTALDDLRVTAVPALRLPLLDELNPAAAWPAGPTGAGPTASAAPAAGAANGAAAPAWAAALPAFGPDAATMAPLGGPGGALPALPGLGALADGSALREQFEAVQRQWLDLLRKTDGA